MSVAHGPQSNWDAWLVSGGILAVALAAAFLLLTKSPPEPPLKKPLAVRLPKKPILPVSRLIPAGKEKRLHEQRLPQPRPLYPDKDSYEERLPMPRLLEEE